MKETPLPLAVPLFVNTSNMQVGQGLAAGHAQVFGSARVLLDSTISLERGSLFYDLLITFVAAFAGLKAVFDAEHYEQFLNGTAGVFTGAVWPSMTTDLGERVKDIRGGAIDSSTAENALCCMLANAAWERTPFKPEHPLWEQLEVQYFRHVRNAASHGNQWFFKARSPDLPAEWRSSKIDATRKGDENEHQGRKCFGDTLGSADLLRLLLDIEALLA